MEQFLQVGVISSTHGLRGEVKVFPTTDDAARFQTLKEVILDTGKEKLDLEIQSVRFFKQFVIVAAAAILSWLVPFIMERFWQLYKFQCQCSEVSASTEKNIKQ